MSEEENGERSNTVKGTIEAATGLVKAIPIYDDMLQPAAKQLGKTLETVCKAVNMALAPVSGLVWGYEQFQAFIDTKVADRLKDIPAEDIITPKPNVAGPAIEALRYTGYEESLTDMYANLLAAAMDKSTSDGAHPAFVEIIKQLTSDEAKLIAYLMEPLPFPLVTVRIEAHDYQKGGFDFAMNVSLLGEKAGLEVCPLVPSYLDNLSRLGLIFIQSDFSYIDGNLYTELENSEKVRLIQQADQLEPGQGFKLRRRAVQITNLGKQFGKICVKGHRQPPENLA